MVDVHMPVFFFGICFCEVKKNGCRCEMYFAIGNDVHHRALTSTRLCNASVFILSHLPTFKFTTN